MNEAGLREQLRQRLASVGRQDAPITATMLWYWKVDTNDGQREPWADGIVFFYAEPPVEADQCEVDENVVLVCATNAQQSCLGGAELAPITFRHGIGEPAIRRSSEVGRFWCNFFDAEDFLDTEDRKLPALIIATGEMRDHQQIGACTMTVTDRLRQIADKYGIPIEFVDPPRPWLGS